MPPRINSVKIIGIANGGRISVKGRYCECKEETFCEGEIRIVRRRGDVKGNVGLMMLTGE